MGRNDAPPALIRSCVMATSARRREIGQQARQVVALGEGVADEEEFEGVRGFGFGYGKLSPGLLKVDWNELRFVLDCVRVGVYRILSRCWRGEGAVNRRAAGMDLTSAQSCRLANC